MSAPTSGAWQQPELVSEFLDQRATLLPLLDVQEDMLQRLFARHRHPVVRFLDIGAGDGAMSQLLLSVEPAATAVLVDYSEPMLARAQERLGGDHSHWQAVRGDLREPAWRQHLPAGPYDAAISSYAIHHLPSQRKRMLFAELFDLLAPGAMFVNLDVVTVAGPLQGLFDEQMVANAIAAEHQHSGARSDEQVERELLADGDDDQPDSLDEQLQWLRHAGFAEVETHFKWAEAVIYGGIRPA
jgi:ubiquinone/menaquinone biosynthesis C-methylase UbiE